MNEVLNWFLVFARVGATLAVLPMFSLQNFPVQLRVGLCALISLLLTPFVPAVSVPSLTLGSLVHLVAVEVSVGLLLGFICRFIFFALEIAGGVMATEMGLTMSSEFNPLNSSVTPVPGVILYWMALMLWLSFDLHHWMIAALQRTYALVPLGAARMSEGLVVEVLRRTANLFAVAVQIAAPILGVSFVISLVFSLLGRAVPQMNVFSESFPVRTLTGSLVFGSTCLFMAHHILNYLRQLPEDVLRVVQLLGSG